jgi:hypothetical protein
VKWMPSSWASVPLPGIETFLEDAKSLTRQVGSGDFWISRSNVVELGTDAERLFLASMIWGYGPSGLGPSRVGRIVQDAGKSLSANLVGIVDASHDGPGNAWDAIHHGSKIKGLGTAFGTKVAYFASLQVNRDRPQVLIADINTSWGAYDAWRIVRSIELRSSYLEYIEKSQALTSLGYRADEIEYGMFIYGKSVLDEQRRASRAKS